MPFSISASLINEYDALLNLLLIFAIVVATVLLFLPSRHRNVLVWYYLPNNKHTINRRAPLSKTPGSHQLRQRELILTSPSLH